MADFRINVIIDPSGARRGGKAVGDTLRNTESAAQRLGRTLTRVFAFAGIGLGIRELVGLTDTFTNLQNRVRTVTSTQEELATVTDELFRISNGTRQSFEATTEVYARTALAARDLGISQRQTLDFTESLNQAVILSGASAQEAQAGLIQLSQGLASGALRGDELRSVLEQLPVIADVIAQELGVTRGQLRELGAEGKISADIVLNAFANAREELAERFGETVPTIGQSFTVLRNQVIRLVGAFNESSGVAAAFSRGILFLADNIETVTRALGALVTVLVVQYAQRAIPQAIAATRTFTLALLKNPFGLIAVAISTSIGLLVAFGDRLKITGDGAATLFDVIAVLGERLAALGQSIAGVVAPALERLGNLFPDVFGQIDFSVGGALRLLARFLDFATQSATIVPRILITGFRVLPNAIREIFIDVVNGAAEQLNRLPGVSIEPIENTFRGAGEVAGNVLIEELRATLEPGVATSFIDGVLADAEQRAQRRAAGGEGPGPTDLTGAGAPAAVAAGTEELDKRRDALNDLLGSLDPVVSLQQQFNDDLTVLNEALESGLITQERYNEVQGQLVEGLETALFQTEEFTDSLTGLEGVFGGLNEAFGRFSGDVVSTFDIASAVGETALNSLTDQINTFVETGKFSFRDFADTVLQELQRIAIQQAVLATFGSFGGPEGGGSGLFGALGGLIQGRQFGGPVQANRPFLVGEGGPELFVPRTAGQVVPNGQAGGTVVQQTFNIQTPDADSFRKSQSQIQKTANRSLRRAEERR